MILEPAMFLFIIKSVWFVLGFGVLMAKATVSMARLYGSSESTISPRLLQAIWYAFGAVTAAITFRLVLRVWIPPWATSVGVLPSLDTLWLLSSLIGVSFFMWSLETIE